MSKCRCYYCGRDIAVNPLTGGLRPHKISQKRHDEWYPDQPYLDGWSGTGSDGKRVSGE